MKTIELEYFDIFNRKHKISVPASKKDEIFSHGYKIDASDFLGIMFVCDGDFILKPVICSKRNEKLKDVYYCRVYDEGGNAVDVQSKKWINELNNKKNQWNQFTANIQSTKKFNDLKLNIL